MSEMTAFILAVLLIVLVGFGTIVWSIFDTRKRYFNEYMERKREREKRAD